jgi:hypothetical protein
MAESIIVNRISGKNKFITVPTDSTNAVAFAGTFLEGEYAVYEKDTVIGASDVVGSAPDLLNVMFKNKTSGLKGYATLSVKKTTTDEAVFAVLMGLTLNGVLIDEAYVISRRQADRW